MNNKAFAPTAIVLAILIVVAGVGVWYFERHQGNPSGGAVVCTMEAMQCPDGSYVGRTGPDCRFVCPSAASSTVPTSSSTSGNGPGKFCGGIATGAFPCPAGYTCKLDGNFPDAGGHCVKN